MNEMRMDYGIGHSQSCVPVCDGAGVTDPLLLTSREAAKVLAVSERTLWTLTNTGEIPCVRMNRSKRYSVSALQAWVAENSVSDTERSATGVRVLKQGCCATDRRSSAEGQEANAIH